MEVAANLLGSAKQWYAQQPIGYYTLTILGVAWIAYIVKQLVPSILFYRGILTSQLPQDPSKPPVIFHLFPWIGSMVEYGMEPYAFFNKARAKVYSHIEFL
jgi:hypothetical protein